ncbi:MAG: class I SAM-dependent methyltransferase [Fulvivirga sp.]
MRGALTKLIPPFIKRILVERIFLWLEAYWKKIAGSIPKYELEAIHIKNTQILLDRKQLLEKLPKNSIVAEIGVNKGEFSAEILALNNPQKLHLIDAWSSSRYNQDIMNSVKLRFNQDQRVIINCGFSTEMAHEFQDAYFDWIYIDSDHSYAVTADELANYAPKVKPNGIIAGHDYIVGNWNKMVRYGVIEAVYEFCVKENWELLYITAENKENPSFAIRKIG